MRKITAFILALALTLSLLVTAGAAGNEVTLTVDASRNGNRVTYTVTMDASTNKVAALQFTLKPSGMTLASDKDYQTKDYQNIFVERRGDDSLGACGFTSSSGVYLAYGGNPAEKNKKRYLTGENPIMTITYTIDAGAVAPALTVSDFKACESGAQAMENPYSCIYPQDPIAVPPASPTGVTVRGSVKSYNPSNQVTIRLLQGAGDEKYKTTIAASTGSGQVPQDFSIANVAPGTYDLEVTKAAHLKYTIKNVVVPSSDLDLTTHSNPAISTITLLCGDVNGDDSITESDVSVIRLSSNINKQITAAGVNPLADVNGDGSVTESDVSIVRLAVHINKSAVNNCTYKF